MENNEKTPLTAKILLGNGFIKKEYVFSDAPDEIETYYVYDVNEDTDAVLELISVSLDSGYEQIYVSGPEAEINSKFGPEWMFVEKLQDCIDFCGIDKKIKI